MSEVLPPGPVTLAAFGGADALEGLERLRANHGDLVRPARPGGEVWLVAGPRIARAVLAERPEDFGKGAPERPGRGLHGVLGGGLLTSRSEPRRLERCRLLQPAFHRHRVDAITAAAASDASTRIVGWRTERAAGELDVYPELEALAARTLQRLLFGRVLDAAASRRLRLPLASGVASPSRGRAARAEVDEVVRAEIARRTWRHSPGGVEDALGLLLVGRDAGRVDEQGILDEMATLVAAGVETTASRAPFALALLARDARAQRAVAEEVDRVLQGGPPTAAGLYRLPRTNAVLDEAVRLFPAIPGVPRRTLRDTLLGGHLVPAGTRLLVSIHVLHRHPHHWRAPAVFRPDRFLEGAPGTRTAYLPFGAGSHMCIGRELARMQGRLAVALALQRLRLGAAEGEPLGWRVAVGLAPDGGTRLRMRPRPGAGERRAG